VSSVTTTPTTDMAMSVCPTAAVSQSRNRLDRERRRSVRRVGIQFRLPLPPQSQMFASNGSGFNELAGGMTFK
jgi:hypothetical protein